MSVLQKLIVKFNKNKNQELYIRIIKEIQNIEKIPNEKLPDVIIDALLKNTKNDWYNGNSTSIEE